MPSEQELLTDQLDNLIEGVKALEETVKECCEKSPDDGKIEDYAQKVVELEKKGDRINEEFYEHLYKGGAVHFSKSDKILLSNGIDKILNFAEICAQYIIARPKTMKVPGDLVKDIIAMSEGDVETVTVLKDCILEINKDFDSARKLAARVEDKRRDVRDLEWKVLKDLMQKLTPELLILKQIVEMLAMVADKAEALSDYIDIMAIKYKTLR